MYSDIFLKNKSITEYQVHIHNNLSRPFKNNNIYEIVKEKGWFLVDLLCSL